MNNLVQNSIAAMPSGGILWLSTAVKGEHFVLSIADSGTGMDEQTVSRIFEPYFYDKGSGHGIGFDHGV